jgi:hypothetical protein
LLLSRTAVSEIGKQLWADYQAFKSRDLAEYDIAYLFIDGIAERAAGSQGRPPVVAPERRAPRAAARAGAGRPGASPSTAARCCST